jgi:hypothetical protein
MQLPVCPSQALLVRRSAHPATCPGPNPNERRSRACPPAQAPPTPAGRGPSSRQSSARSPAIAARNAPRRGHTPKGPAFLAVPRPSWAAMARFERHGSDLAARPNVAWGATADPAGSCGTRPGGAQAGAARPRAGGSGCATQGEPRGPSSALRTGLAAADRWDPSINQTQSPARTPTSECLALGHAALGC